MGDIGSDTDSGLELVVDAYRNLEKFDPSNELLRYAKVYKNGQEVKFSPEYYERFHESSDKLVVQGYVRYFQALETALESKQQTLPM